MAESINEKIIRWDHENSTLGVNSFNEAYNFVVYLDNLLFQNYEPTRNFNTKMFKDRFIEWLNNTTNEEQQKVLFQLIPHIFYIGTDEFDNLFRIAFNYNIINWIIEKNNLKIDDDDLSLKVSETIQKTWFCPVSDSMRINGFYHINQICNGIEYRPDWRSLAKFGDSQKLIEFIKTQKIEYIVLLEDFVASGSQASETIDFAIKISKQTAVKILFLPLVICPEGEKVIENATSNEDSFTYSCVLKIPETSFVKYDLVYQKDHFFSKLITTIKELHELVSGSSEFDDVNDKSYGPFGFKKSGALIVLYSNCPNNTLPIIHYEHTSWKSLFPRTKRI